MAGRARIASGAILVIVALIPLAPVAQTPGQTSTAAPVLLNGRGVILGRIVDSETGAPIEDATVILHRSASQRLDEVRTTSAGEFAFRRVPAGRWEVGAVKSTHRGTSGRRTVVDLAEGQVHSDVVIALEPFSALGGRVFGPDREPVVGVTVRLARRSPRGQWRAFSSAVTNDLGEYRFVNLLADEFLVLVPSNSVTLSKAAVAALRAMSDGPRTVVNELAERLRAAGISGRGALALPTMRVLGVVMAPERLSLPPVLDSGRVHVFETVYHPGVREVASATPISVRPGEARDAVDFQLTPVPATNVAGTLRFDTGPAEPTVVTLEPVASDTFDLELPAATTVSDGGGGFEFSFVPVGQYDVRVLQTPLPPGAAAPIEAELQTGGDSVALRAPAASRTGRAALQVGPLWWARESIVVTAAGVTGLEVTVRRGATVSGRLVFDGDGPTPSAVQIQRAVIQFHQAVGLATPYLPGRFDETGAFVTPELAPGRYVASLGPIGTWRVRDITLDGHNVADQPFELGSAPVQGVTITMTDRGPALAGTLRDTEGQILPGGHVVVFSTERRWWEDGGPLPRRMRTVRASADGAYSLTSVPAGEYFVVGLADKPRVDWHAPHRLRAFALRAARVTLTEGQQTRADLRVVPLDQARRGR